LMDGNKDGQTPFAAIRSPPAKQITNDYPT
jgi:hypothetical protein